MSQAVAIPFKCPCCGGKEFILFQSFAMLPFEALPPEQQAAVPPKLHGRHVMAQAPSGNMECRVCGTYLTSEEIESAIEHQIKNASSSEGVVIPEMPSINEITDRPDEDAGHTPPAESQGE